MRVAIAVHVAQPACACAMLLLEKASCRHLLILTSAQHCPPHIRASRHSFLQGLVNLKAPDVKVWLIIIDTADAHIGVPRLPRRYVLAREVVQVRLRAASDVVFVGFLLTSVLLHVQLAGSPDAPLCICQSWRPSIAIRTLAACMRLHRRLRSMALHVWQHRTRLMVAANLHQMCRASWRAPRTL